MRNCSKPSRTHQIDTHVKVERIGEVVDHDVWRHVVNKTKSAVVFFAIDEAVHIETIIDSVTRLNRHPDELF